MTPKERAKYLIHEYHTHLFQGKNDNHQFAASKLAALIAVNEILNELNNMNIYEYTKAESCVGRFLFWQEVKQEIEKC